MEYIKTKTIENDEDFLRQVSATVLKEDNDLSRDISLLEKYCQENDVLALAAVQIGIPKRLIYLKNTNLDVINRHLKKEDTVEDKVYNEARILINPIIISKEGLTDYWEACASCMDNFGHVNRPYKILVEYEDINFNKHRETFEGFESTVLCHEIDHLDGILHIDIAVELLIMEAEERKKFRLKHNYNIVRKTGKFE